MDPHHHSAPVPLASLVVDGVLVPWPARWVFDTIKDIGERGTNGFLVFFGDTVRVQRRKIRESVDKLIAAAIGGICLQQLRYAGVGVRVRDNV